MKKLLILCLLTCTIALQAQQSKPITLEDIWKNGTFRPAGIREIRSMNDGEHYCILEDPLTINKYEYKSGKKTTELFSIRSIEPTDGKKIKYIADYQFSKDEKQVLISTNIESIYRHSTTADYYLYNYASQTLKPLSEGGKQRLAEFSPDGSKIAFVRDNNLFITDLVTGKEEALTTDGKFNEIIYGSTDWVYEEEFAFTKAFFWSPDGKQLAYYRMDESKVKQFDMTIWGELYPDKYTYKYPKAGENNSIVSIHVYDLSSKMHKKMDVGNNPDQYIPRIKWSATPYRLAIYRMNRLQNHLDILLANTTTGTTQTVYTETNPRYISINDDLYFLEKSQQFILTSEKNGYNHIYLCNINNKQQTQLTKGKWEVSEIIGVNEANGEIYYLSTETSSLNKDLFSIQIRSGKTTRISKKAGTTDAQFSKNFKYYISTWSDANTPNIYTINDKKGKELVVLEDNSKLSAKLDEYKAGKKEFGTFTTSDGTELNYWMMLPADFDVQKKYPVLMYVYGGPGSQLVLNKFDAGGAWFRMLTQQGYIVVCVDNRGTGGQGEAFKKITYRQLGNYEVQDQIEASKFIGNMKNVDPKRIGIFGWSYGGYMSSMCMLQGAAYFKVGIAVAPVTDWRYYDNIYTERYMGLPADNTEGYQKSALFNYADQLQGKYLLIHGTADDNVHVQNSMDWITKLAAANKQFDMFFYPNKNHSIYGGNTRLHLYTMMTNYILENL